MNYAVILAGGRGERFWPKSRIKKPKQLQKIFSDKMMLEETIDRIEPIIGVDYMRIITTETLASQILKKIDKVKMYNIISEPSGKNTAPAIALATSQIIKEDPDAVLVILSSDHKINDEAAFRENIKYAIKVAKEENEWVIFGMKPNYPETGYGYIELGSELENDILYEVESFKEKPNLETAKYFLSTHKYLWNSGIFVATAKTIWDSFKKYLPEVYNELNGISNITHEYHNLRQAYNKFEKISIDYAIMEKLKRVLVIKANFDWDDMGSWLSMKRHLSPDLSQNVKLGDVVSLDTENSITISYDGLIATIGVSDLVVVKVKDAVLVCSKDKVHKIPSLLKMVDDKYK